MGFLKTLFGGKDESPEEKRKRDEARQLDMLKTDGIRAIHIGKYDYAIKCLTKALEMSDELELHDYLSQAYIQNDQLREGFGQLQLLAAAQPENIQIFTTMAKVAYMMEDYQAMSDACEKATLLDKDNAEVMFLYARCSLGQGDKVNAVAMLTKTILLDENFHAAYLDRGDTLLKMGDIEGASEDADHLMTVADGAEDVLLLKGRVLLAQNKPSEAADIFTRAIENNPFCTAAYRGRGTARLTLGDKEGAESDMRQVLEQDPHALDDINGHFSAQGKD